MKSNLLLKKYKITTDYGTKNLKPQKSFFGSIMLDVEDEILIDNSSISYKQISNPDDRNQDGYQYYDLDTLGLESETEYSFNLSDLKEKNHTIKLYNQSEDSVARNTSWEYDINVKNILRNYLFYRLKEKRVFKCIKNTYFINNNINLSIYKYIDENLINRYSFDQLNFYVNYYDITRNQTYLNTPLLQLDPKYDVTVYSNEYKINNVDVVKKDNFENLQNLKVIYNQIKEAGRYKFNYYFTLNYKRI